MEKGKDRNNNKKKNTKKGTETSHLIFLLSVPYKVFECIILNRIRNTDENHIPREQRAWKRSCVDQVVALTHYIENNSFQKKIKATVAFMDLSSAYDTIWRDVLMLTLKDSAIYENNSYHKQHAGR